ncbi:unnamed protein product [Ceutorhynchus assimilis]|uniref:Uncharacterized protein n=1 Tax=Ceutorhynchus assimilis TaxID=467358 RepID=A0A9P0DFG7_9CUCU|nr:unnamed protein product [Ceutorhynchus assimilis]
MVKSVFFIVVCSFIYLNHATPVQETNQYLPFENAIEALKDIDIAEQLTKMFFKCPEQASANVIALMNTKNYPKVSDVLNAFNEAFDINLFIIVDDDIQLDIKAFEIVLYRNYQEYMNPFNLKQPEEAFLLFKQEIKMVSDAVREAENKLPVERLVATLEAQSRATGIRERWTLKPTCKYFATKNIRNNLSDASKALTVLPFAESQNGISFVHRGVGFLKEFLSYADDIVSLTSNTCRTKKIRAVDEDIESNEQLLTTRGVILIIEDLMGLISSSMNTILMSILHSIREAVETVFNNILGVIVYLQNIISAVYPCTFCTSKIE